MLDHRVVEIELDAGSVWHAMPEALVLVTGSVTIAALNSTAERFFGYCSDEVRGEPLELLLPAGPIILEDAGPDTLTVSQARLRNATSVPVSVGSVPLLSRPDMQVALVRDMRALVAWRTALEESVRRGNDEKAQQLYAAGMAVRRAFSNGGKGTAALTAIDEMLAAIDEVIIGLGRGPVGST